MSNSDANCIFNFQESVYTDPHTKLNYSSSQEFKIIRKLPSDIVSGYLTLRRANVQLQWDSMWGIRTFSVTLICSTFKNDSSLWFCFKILKTVALKQHNSILSLVMFLCKVCEVEYSGDLNTRYVWIAMVQSSLYSNSIVSILYMLPLSAIRKCPKIYDSDPFLTQLSLTGESN